jgi:hypothetical protein
MVCDAWSRLTGLPPVVQGQRLLRTAFDGALQPSTLLPRRVFVQDLEGLVLLDLEHLREVRLAHPEPHAQLAVDRNPHRCVLSSRWLCPTP